MAGLITEKNDPTQKSKTAIAFWIIFLVLLVYWVFPLFDIKRDIPDTLFWTFSSLIGVGILKNGLTTTEKILKKEVVKNDSNCNNNINNNVNN